MVDMNHISKVPKSVKPKGQPRGGSRKGKPNKVSSDIKQMLLEALSEAGGKAYFLRQAQENPSSFNTLIAKIIPAEVKQELTGKDGGPLESTVSIKHHPELSPEQWAATFGPK